jgi:hypothetical protein
MWLGEEATGSIVGNNLQYEPARDALVRLNQS